MPYLNKTWVNLNTLLSKAEIYWSNQSFDLDAPDFTQEQQNAMEWEHYMNEMEEMHQDEYLYHYYG